MNEEAGPRLKAGVTGWEGYSATSRRSPVATILCAMSITKRQIGLAAVILLAPGGFILGAALLANRYRKPRAEAETETPPKP